MSKSSAFVTVIKPGSKVRFGANIEGTVLATTIRQNGATLYLVSWWDNTIRAEEWLDACEIVDDEPEKVKIGFM